MLEIDGLHTGYGETTVLHGLSLRAAKGRVLAILGRAPTLTELGVKVTYAVSRGILAPKGTPEPALAKLEDVCRKVTSDPAFAAEMKKHGTDVKFLDRKAYASFLEKSDAENAELASALGYKRKP